MKDDKLFWLEECTRFRLKCEEQRAIIIDLRKDLKLSHEIIATANKEKQDLVYSLSELEKRIAALEANELEAKKYNETRILKIEKGPRDEQFEFPNWLKENGS